MTNPITPPPDLVQQWLCSHDFVWGPLEEPSITIMATRLQNVATQAARWGANQELEACVKLASEMLQDGNSLRAARRPKPPSLKEQALEQLACIQTDLNKFGMGISTNTIRTAMEALDD